MIEVKPQRINPRVNITPGVNNPEEREIQEFLCPISRKIMTDPVITKQGNTYERSQLQKLFKKGNKFIVQTGEALNAQVMNDLIPNRTLKNTILHHDEKLMKMEKDALQNLIEQSDNLMNNIKELFPTLMSSSNGVQVAKIEKIYKDYFQLQTLTKLMAKNFEKLCNIKCKNRCEHEIFNEEFHNIGRVINEQIDPILYGRTLLDQKEQEYSIDYIEYMIISSDKVRDIDWNRMKRKELKTKFLKGHKLNEKTLEQIQQQIRQQNRRQISNDHQMKIWKAGESLSKIYSHISTCSSELIGDYNSGIKGVGKRLIDTDSKINDLTQGQYLIVSISKRQEEDEEYDNKQRQENLI